MKIAKTYYTKCGKMTSDLLTAEKYGISMIKVFQWSNSQNRWLLKRIE